MAVANQGYPAGGRAYSNSLKRPTSFKIGNRRFFRDSQINHLKKCLIAKAMGKTPPEYEEPESEKFVPAPKVATELGISKRTFWRRVKDAEERLAATAGEGAR